MIQEAVVATASITWEPGDYAAILSAIAAIVAIGVGFFSTRDVAPVT